MSSEKSDKLPGRNTFKRWIGPGMWEDADGNAHIDVPMVHQMMRDQGIAVKDTPEQIKDTMMVMTMLLKNMGIENIIPRDSAED